MIRLYFIRHGETLSNIWHTLQGWSDTPLTKDGIAQGKALGKGLSDIPFIKIYTSTSERAYDTACYARGNRSIDIFMNRGLKEMNFGTYETKPNTFQGCETYLERITYRWKEVGGENLEDVCVRMKQTIQNILEESQQEEGNIMCVSHGISILAALRYMDKDVYDTCIREETRFGNCSVTVVSYDHGCFHVEEINNMRYVQGGYHEKNH